MLHLMYFIEVGYLDLTCYLRILHRSVKDDFIDISSEKSEQVLNCFSLVLGLRLESIVCVK